MKPSIVGTVVEDRTDVVTVDVAKTVSVVVK